MKILILGASSTFNGNTEVEYRLKGHPFKYDFIILQKK